MTAYRADLDPRTRIPHRSLEDHVFGLIQSKDNAALVELVKIFGREKIRAIWDKYHEKCKERGVCTHYE